MQVLLTLIENHYSILLNLFLLVSIVFIKIHSINKLRLRQWVLRHHLLCRVGDDDIPALHFGAPFLYLYVDDILTAVPSVKMNIILHIFNKYHPNLQFTSEIARILFWTFWSLDMTPY